jgi:hypothetical protein
MVTVRLLNLVRNYEKCRLAWLYSGGISLSFSQRTYLGHPTFKYKLTLLSTVGIQLHQSTCRPQLNLPMQQVQTKILVRIYCNSISIYFENLLKMINGYVHTERWTSPFKMLGMVRVYNITLHWKNHLQAQGILWNVTFKLIFIFKFPREMSTNNSGWTSFVK